MRARSSTGRFFGGAVAILVGLSVGVVGAAAHVDYVTDETGAVAPIPFLLEVLVEPINLLLLGGGGLAVVAAAAAYLRVRPAARDVAVFRETMADYRDLLPWLLRLSFGLPLVGAGFAGYFFSPSVAPFVPVLLAPSRLFQVAVGFSLLFGLATRVGALVGLAAYLVGLATNPALLLAGEYVPGLVAIALVGSGRPSADHVLKRLASADGTVYGEFDPVHRASAWLNRTVEPYESAVPVVARVGLGLNFVFLGVTQKLLAPGPALAVVEKYDLTALVPVEPGLWVVGAGLGEAALGAALIVGLFTRASAVAALFTFTLTLFGLPDDPVLAHVTLFGLASVVLIIGAGPLSADAWIRQRVAGGAPGAGAGGTLATDD